VVARRFYVAAAARLDRLLVAESADGIIQDGG
jgi:hypothetical protein